MLKLSTILTTAFIVALANLATAQTKTIKYLSKSGVNEVPASEAYYFEMEEVHADSIYTGTRYRMEDSTKVNLQTYKKVKAASGTLKTKYGPQRAWHRNGNMAEEFFYEEGKPKGEYKRWYESGKIQYKRIYNNATAPDTLTGYYESGKVRRLEVYTANKMTSGKVYDEAGNEISYMPMFEDPSFPGGVIKLMSWISSNMKYPRTTRIAKAHGRVMVNFMVDETGKISDADVIKGIHPDADAEALRLINRMPAWEPGKMEGKPAKLRVTLPINFPLYID